jgi:hypothetical protein
LALSVKTLTVIASTNKLETQDYYPHATWVGTTLNPWYGETVMRLNEDDVPSTTRDMSKAFKFEHGDKIRGTHANENIPLKNHRNDINKGFGQQGNYKDFYIDTFKPVGEQLKKR